MIFFFHVGIFLKLIRYHDCVPMLSLMLFLDCSSDHWKYERLLVCYCKPYGENSCINNYNYKKKKLKIIETFSRVIKNKRRIKIQTTVKLLKCSTKKTIRAT